MNNQPLRQRKFGEYIQDFTALGNPFLLLLVSFFAIQNIRWISPAQIWLVLIGGFLANEFICSGIKYIWHKPRPNAQTFGDGMEKIDAGSFPSIHAARISFVYSSLAYLHYTENQGFILPAICLLVIILVGYSRVFLRRHFAFDVLAGYVFGFLMSGLVWKWAV